MKKFFHLPLVAAVFLFGTACDDQLDINEDPLAATQVDANLLFPEILVNFSNIRESELDARIGTIPQYYEPAFGVIGDYFQGTRSNTFLMGNVWSNIYTNVLKNAALMERTALEAEPGTQDNILAQAKIMKSLAFWQATMLYEDVPYTEAADFVTELPTFNSQETVLRGLVTDLNDAMALIDEESAKVENGDLVYDGDMELWRLAANSLKFKILMYIANVDESVSGEIASTAAAGLMETASQNAKLDYLDAPGNFNPFWSILNNFAGGVNPTWYIASNASFGLIASLDDPRLDIYYDESATDSIVGTGNYGPSASPGSFSGSGGTAAILSDVTLIRPDRPDTYIVASETQLLLAEAIVRGFVEGDAQEAMALGIKASIDEYDGTVGEVADDAVEAYIESLGDLDDDDDDDALLKIRQQLYIANFERLPDGWAEWRRTKVPSLTTPAGSLVTGIVRRFFYPPDEVGANPNAPSPKALDAPMWYEN